MMLTIHPLKLYIMLLWYVVKQNLMLVVNKSKLKVLNMQTHKLSVMHQKRHLLNFINQLKILLTQETFIKLSEGKRIYNAKCHLIQQINIHYLLYINKHQIHIIVYILKVHLKKSGNFADVYYMKEELEILMHSKRKNLIK